MTEITNDQSAGDPALAAADNRVAARIAAAQIALAQSSGYLALSPLAAVFTVLKAGLRG